MHVEVRVEDRATQAALRYAATVLAHTGPLMRTLADGQFRSTADNFRLQAFDGQPWRPLARRTINAPLRSGGSRGRGRGRRRRAIRRRGPENILHPTGQHLLQQLHQSSTQTEAIVACATGWAWVHNYGARLRSVTIPQRTFLGLTSADYVRIQQAVQFHVFRALGRFR